MIDSEKVERQLTAMIESLKPHCEGSEPNNVLARLQADVVPAFIRWKLGEANRRTHEDGVLNAFVCFVSSQMVGTIGELLGDPDAGEAHFQLANRLLQAIGEEVGSILTGERSMANFSVAAERTH